MKISYNRVCGIMTGRGHAFGLQFFVPPKVLDRGAEKKPESATLTMLWSVLRIPAVFPCRSGK